LGGRSATALLAKDLARHLWASAARGRVGARSGHRVPLPDAGRIGARSDPRSALRQSTAPERL